MIARIPLASRGFALVDADDLSLVSPMSWHLHGSYARHTTHRDGRVVRVYMHRLITGAVSGQVVDHINGDGLDNRRSNLRLATAVQNGQNRRGAATNNRSSGALGVYRSKRGHISAYITVDRRRIYLGSFATIEVARAARRAAEVEMFGAFAPQVSP